MTAVVTDRDRNGPRAPGLDGELLGGLRRIELAQLIESPWNPRKHFDPAKLAEMAESLRKGQLAPIIVRPIAGKHERYEIGAGHRRFRAAPLADMNSLLAIVRDLDDVSFLELLTIENKQREDVAPLDEANGFRLLMEKAGYDVAKLAARIGLSTKYVYDRLKLLQLIPAAKKLLEDGTITAGHAILLARLSPTDQKRAIGDVKEVVEGSYGDSLLLRPDHGAEEQDELPLHDRVKPVSVREFQQAIQEKIRATPEHLDPFLFPESAAALEVAKEETLSVIHITRGYLASDEVRHADEKQRVFGSPSWKRADGGVEEDDDYLGRSRGKIKSKTCEWSRYGFVASGPGQGEVFKVCINKQKCKIHWPEHVKRAEAAKKRAKKAPAATSSGSEEKRQKAEAVAELKRAREEQHTQRVEDVILRLIQDRAPQWALGVGALAKQIKLPAEFASWMSRDRRLEPDLENDIDYGEAGERARHVFDAMRPKLGGGWSKRGLPETAAAQPVALALLFWLNNSLKSVEAELERDAEKIVVAEEKAAAVQAKKAAKKPAKKKAKKGGR